MSLSGLQCAISTVRRVRQFIHLEDNLQPQVIKPHTGLGKLLGLYGSCAGWVKYSFSNTTTAHSATADTYLTALRRSLTLLVFRLAPSI
eukprot:scaffold433668_cov42-Prasinocladus_malaysianus.AAC.1